MSVPDEYNVIGGLLGLGPDILLEILSELRLISNAVQFIGICKKIYILKDHDRFYKIMGTLNYPIEIYSSCPSDIEFIDIDGVQKKITKKQEKFNIVSINQNLEEGIWSFETIFISSKCQGNGGVGIVRDSYNIPVDANPTCNPHNQHMAMYIGKDYGEGRIYYKGIKTHGNIAFTNNQIVKLEFDSEKGSLTYFVDGVQQPIYISGIKEKVRFFVVMYFTYSFQTFRSLKRLAAPTSGHVENEKAIQW
ncbi:MAG: hypothetical protein EZS28_019783 [Streblomastix strix]|uniref:SPRY domain-containing protein n=1 Tax=Streblomastix strix TaxID=222440 RepID=A0A5J4VQC2_9EUKA|nr:MAG: hypothetical protein EZS28_019783 [Streblomastix strix]